MELIDLDSLVGRTVKLSGVDFGEVKAANKWDEDANCLRFVADGITYTATEDPSDGYRSTFGQLYVGDGGVPVKNTFSPVECVVVNGRLNNRYGAFDGISFLYNGKELLVLGTDDSDGYYPSSVLEFDPLVLGETG